MLDRLLDIAADHGLLTGYIIAAEGSVGPVAHVIEPEKIAGHDFFKSIAVGIIDMIVDHVHDDADISIVVGSNGRLQF